MQFFRGQREEIRRGIHVVRIRRCGNAPALTYTAKQIGGRVGHWVGFLGRRETGRSGQAGLNTLRSRRPARRLGHLRLQSTFPSAYEASLDRFRPLVPRWLWP